MGFDLIIPLGTGSKSNNDELKILLRSADRNAVGLGRVIIVTQEPPAWLRNAYIVPMGDHIEHNKDANLINKVILALATFGIREDFILCADDNVFNQKTDLDAMPMLYNSKSNFKEDGNNWQKRMVRTMDFLVAKGMPSDRNYETHTPQMFNAGRIFKGIKGIDYIAEPGYGIYSLFRCISDDKPDMEQSRFKTTHESEESVKAPMNKMFVGYNDKAFLNGLRERLFRAFPDKSRYEA